MTMTAEVSNIFTDAEALHASAMEMLERGDIRDAAGKAWCATRRATNALILAHTGEEPGTTAMTSDGLDALARQDSEVKILVGRYYSRLSQLHGQCFYNRRCGSEDTERRIRETDQYIRDAEMLADS